MAEQNDCSEEVLELYQIMKSNFQYNLALAEKYSREPQNETERKERFDIYRRELNELYVLYEKKLENSKKFEKTKKNMGTIDKAVFFDDSNRNASYLNEVNKIINEKERLLERYSHSDYDEF